MAHSTPLRLSQQTSEIGSALDKNLVMAYTVRVHAFFAQTLHQPLLATILLPNTAQLPDGSVALP